MSSSISPSPSGAPPTSPARDREARIEERGRRLLERAAQTKAPMWARERWEEALMRRLMSDERFKTQALRFVDVLPALRSDDELVRHLSEYFQGEELPIPGVAQWGLALAQRSGVAAAAAAIAVRRAITSFAHRFIGGANVRDAFRTVEQLRRDGMAFTLDVLGEATVSEAEAEGYRQRYLELIEALAPLVAKWPLVPLLDQTSTRPAARLDLSVKLSALYSQINPADPEGSAAAIRDRLRPILRRARETGAAVTFDMEQYDLKDTVLCVFQELLMEPEFRDWPDAGIAIQAYLRETETDLPTLIDWARRRGTPIKVRLVRGAYWDYETVIARQHGWPIPVFTRKEETDRLYERGIEWLFEAYPHVEPAIATHNVRSIALALTLAEERGIDPRDYEIQMLYGMADALKEAVVAEGVRLRVYVPFGELIPGMAYLVRRLLENTASQSFLRLGFAEHAPPEVLLRPPAPAPSPDGHAPPPSGYRIEPVHRFTDEGEREQFRRALARVREQMGRHWPLVIGGRPVDTADRVVSTDPARPSVVVGTTAAATADLARAAVEAAATAFPAWRETPPAERAALLRRAAERMRVRRDELAAWEVYEVAKNWREADADVTEAIDYLEYYAEQMLRLARGHRFDVPGEENAYGYQPRGVVAVIPPWNFPLAILTGMTSAALVTGNTVVMKPASQSPVIAAQLMEILAEAGLPPGVANFLPGPGAEVGEALVTHPLTAMIAFTGSRAVGTRIYSLAAQVQPGQTHLKRVIAELGGKNAIVIDSDADIDDAVLGTIVSAFGYQGQKCSACSRVIVLEDAYDAFLARLIEAARSLPIGHPEDPRHFMGPVIEQRAQERIRRIVAEGKAYATVVLEVDVGHLGEGWWVGPTIFTDVPPDSPLAQEEIFGPVLCVFRVRTFDEALALANDSIYALTGGLYSRSPARIEQAKREFRVGNLYINRKITGAIVGRQPFGGFKMSGIGSKAGGPDYLLHFVEPRTVTENTLRRGFAPQEPSGGER